MPGYNPAVDQAFGLKPTRSRIRVSSRRDSASRGRRRSGAAWDRPPARADRSRSAAFLPDLPPGVHPWRCSGRREASLAPGWAINGSIGGVRQRRSTTATSPSLIDQTGLPEHPSRADLRRRRHADPGLERDHQRAADKLPRRQRSRRPFRPNVPSVQVYDPAFQHAAVWRANLGIDGIRLPKKWTLGITGLLQLRRQSAERARPEPESHAVRSRLAAKANRPVYVSPDAIVPETGVDRAEVPTGSTRTTARSQDIVSDLHNYTAQVQATIAPPHPLLHNKLTLSMTYVLQPIPEPSSAGSAAVAAASAISAPSVSAPVAFPTSASAAAAATRSTAIRSPRRWVSGNQPTHQIRTNASFRAWWFNVSTRSTCTPARRSRRR